jgi:hypothetical protein
METRDIIKILSLVTFVLLPFIIYGIILPLQRKSGFVSGSGSGGGDQMLLSKVPDVCSDLGNRTDCLTAKGCGWCESAGMCMKASHANQCESGMVMSPNQSSGFTGGAVMPDSQKCNWYKDCKSCSDASGCGWCQTDKTCKLEDRWGASGGKCRPEGAFITSSNTCNSKPDTGGPIIVRGVSTEPVSSELLGNTPANAVNLSSRAPAATGAQPPSGADIQVAASPEAARRGIPATGAINAPGSGTVAADATKSATPATTAASTSPQVATCGTKVSFKLSELPAIQAKIQDDILKVLRSTRAT